MRSKRKFQGLLAAGSAVLLFFIAMGCTDSNVGSHILSQPFTPDRYFFKGKVTNLSGQPVPGAAVSIHFLLLAQDKITPFSKALQTLLYPIYTTKEIFDIFDNPVAVLYDTVYCDTGPCAAQDPAWDGTNDQGKSVPMGFYRVLKQDFTVFTQTEDTVVATESWTCREGVIDTTDQAGGFIIPPLPWETVPIQSGGGPVEYFKGWVELSFSRTGYITHTDTVDVFADLPDFVLSPSAGGKARK